MRRVTRKPGPNQGRAFFCCVKPMNSRCKFFLWEDKAMEDTSSFASKSAIAMPLSRTDISRDKMDEGFVPSRYDAAGRCLAEGLRVEAVFEALAKELGFTVKAASRKTDKEKHYDMTIINESGQEARVEVKSMKRISRRDAAAQDTNVWVELHGVSDKGWLYDGHSHVIAFETATDFKFVEREKLVEWVDANVDKEAHVSTATDAVKKVYSREGRPDLLTLVPLEELERDGIVICAWIKNAE